MWSQSEPAVIPDQREQDPHAMGVAKPSAQGQAITNTATAVVIDFARSA